MCLCVCTCEYRWTDGWMDGWMCAVQIQKKKAKLMIKCNEYGFDKSTLIKLGIDTLTMYRIVEWYT